MADAVMAALAEIRERLARIEQDLGIDRERELDDRVRFPDHWELRQRHRETVVSRLVDVERAVEDLDANSDTVPTASQSDLDDLRNDLEARIDQLES